MKKNNLLSWAGTLAGAALCSILFAFSSPMGAHQVQVYFDTRLVIDQYISYKTDVPKLTLDPAEKYKQLIVKYSECGRTVTGRKITLKDNNDKVLKDWDFEGTATGFQQPMSCLIKDILALKQKENNTVKLYYSSNEFPQGQQIAYLVIGSNATASK